jgi:hypothetical protein
MHHRGCSEAQPVDTGTGMANKKLITDMKFDLEEDTCLWKQCTLLLYDPDGWAGINLKHC